MPTTADQLLGLERRRFDAAIEADVESLRDLLHPRLTYAHSNGARDTFETLIEKIETGVFDYVHVESGDQEVVLTGDIGVITAVQRAEVRVDGVPVHLHNATLAVWIRQDDVWRLLAFQPTPIR